MVPWLRWGLGSLLAALLTLSPYLYYRAEYTHGKRLREVTPGVLYRSGQMTVAGFTEAVQQYHIRTIVNAQDEYPDPDSRSAISTIAPSRKASCAGNSASIMSFCRRTCCRAVSFPVSGPQTIDKFLALMDDPANQPVLLHCRAGLHRTGVLTQVYRMEYLGYSPREAVDDIKANGFGEFVCSSANDYIMQYILTYRAANGTREKLPTEE